MDAIRHHHNAIQSFLKRRPGYDELERTGRVTPNHWSLQTPRATGFRLEPEDLPPRGGSHRRIDYRDVAVAASFALASASTFFSHSASSGRSFCAMSWRRFASSFRSPTSVRTLKTMV
jgi:hypothetical protein